MREPKLSEQELSLEAFELELDCSFKQAEGQDFKWRERRLLLRSEEQAQAAEKRLSKNLAQAQAELAALTKRRRGKTPVKTLAELERQADKVVKRFGLSGLLKLKLEEQTQEQQVRGYGGQAARIEVSSSFQLEVEVDEEALRQTQARFGWRVLVTNQEAALLPLEKALRVYRNSYRHEHGYSRLKGTGP